MKKYLSLVLAVMILVSAFVSCGNEIDINEDNSSQTGTQNSESELNNSSAPDDSTGGAPIEISSATDGNSSEDESKTPETESKNPAYEPQGGEFSFPNGLLLIGDRCMESFGGSYDNANLYYQYVTEHKDKLGEDVNVYSMVVPTASSIYLQELVIDGENYYDKYGGKQVDKLGYLDELFEEDDKVVSVNVYDTLFEHWNEAIYFRTDWHWTQLGAYYAAKLLGEKAGLEIADINSDYYTKAGKYNEDGSFKPFLGSLYASAGRPQALKNSPEEFFWYEFNHEYTVDYYDRETGTKLKTTRTTCYPNISDDYVSSWYMTFLDADNNVCKINTGTKNGRVAVVFKVSFGNCFAPMLSSMFETVYTVDFRYFTGNSVTFCQDVGATDVIFALSSFSAMGPNCLNIGRMVRR